MKPRPAPMAVACVASALVIGALVGRSAHAAEDAATGSSPTGWLEVLVIVAIAFLALARATATGKERRSKAPTWMGAKERSLALLLLFAGSGCAALIYEVVWLQMLELTLGSSAVSIGVLLGTFMGGMCLGSLALSRFVKENGSPCAYMPSSRWRSARLGS
jgi:hypothetical protein